MLSVHSIGILAAAILLLSLPCASFGRSPAPIEVERVINAPISDVWKAWTTSEGIQSFLGCPSTIELRQGGKYEIYFAPDAEPGSRGSEGCTVLSYLHERQLSFAWNAPPKYPGVRNGSRHSFVVLEFSAPDPTTTLVRLSHGGWPSTEEAGNLAEEWTGTRAYFENAWPNVLNALAERFPPTKDAPDPKAGWTYLIVGLSRPDLIQTMTEDEKRILGEHYEYLKEHTRQGRVVVAGPCTDGKGPGIVVFHASNEASAREFMENDPAVKAGIFKTELHPMRLSLQASCR